MPLPIHAETANTRPETSIPIFPIMSYGCIAAKMTVWSITAITGSLNHDPKVCMRSPRNAYSSAIHCKGPRMVTTRKLNHVNFIWKSEISCSKKISFTAIGMDMHMNAIGNVFQNTLLLHPPLADEYEENGLSRTMTAVSHSAGIITATVPRLTIDCQALARSISS